MNGAKWAGRSICETGSCVDNFVVRRTLAQSIILPTLLIVAGTTGAVLVATKRNALGPKAKTTASYATTAEVLDALRIAKTATAHARVTSWTVLLGHDDARPLNMNEVSEAVLVVEEKLRGIATSPTATKTTKAKGTTTEDFKRLQTALAKARNTDAKLRHGGLSEMAYVLDDIAAKELRPFGPLVPSDQGLSANVDAMDLHDFILTLRSGRGVDVAPSNPELVAYLNGAIAGLGPSNPDRLTLSSALTASSGTQSPVAKRLLEVAGEPTARPLANEAAWALRNGTTSIKHVPVNTLTASTHATIERIDGVVRDELTVTKQAIQKETADLNSRTQRLTTLLGALALFVIGGVAWLLRRLHVMVSALRLASERDELTALLNRVGLRTKTEPWFAERTSPIALAVIDLDRFKLVNDTFGHQAGDRLLQNVGERISKEVIASRTAVARWGGDEFVVALRLGPDGTPGDVGRVSERIRQAISLPLDINGDIASVGSSIGACICTCGACDLDDLFRLADRRLYDVKREGRNAVLIAECSTAGFVATLERVTEQLS
jgi:diguanylate cyclase (GGDEF)-like protein